MLEASPCLCFKEILGFSILSRMRSPTSPGSSVPSRATNSTHPQHWRSQCRRSIPSLPFNWNVPGQMQQLTFTDYSWFEFIPCLRLRLADCFFSTDQSERHQNHIFCIHFLLVISFDFLSWDGIPHILPGLLSHSLFHLNHSLSLIVLVQCWWHALILI